MFLQRFLADAVVNCTFNSAPPEAAYIAIRACNGDSPHAKMLRTTSIASAWMNCNDTKILLPADEQIGVAGDTEGVRTSRLARTSNDPASKVDFFFSGVDGFNAQAFAQ